MYLKYATTTLNLLVKNVSSGQTAITLSPGKAVFSEKPIGETPEDTKTCYMTAEKVGKPLFCGFQRRYDPTFADIQARVRRGMWLFI